MIFRPIDEISLRHLFSTGASKPVGPGETHGLGASTIGDAERGRAAASG